MTKAKSLLNTISEIIDNHTEEKQPAAIASSVRYHLADALNLYQNIQTTSAGEADKKQRLQDMAAQYGLTYSVRENKFY